MNDLFNSIENTINKSLNKVDNKVHRNNISKIKNTFIDDFIHELRDYLNKRDALYELNKLPRNTILEIDTIEEKYFACYHPLTYDRYDIPKYKVDYTSKQQGYFCLQLQGDGLYHYVPNN